MNLVRKVLTKSIFFICLSLTTSTMNASIEIDPLVIKVGECAFKAILAITSYNFGSAIMGSQLPGSPFYGRQMKYELICFATGLGCATVSVCYPRVAIGTFLTLFALSSGLLVWEKLKKN